MNLFLSYKHLDKQALIKSLVSAAGLSLLIIFAIPPLLINPILNGLKNNAVNQVKTGTASAGSASYNLFFNEARIENISYSGSAGSFDSVQAQVRSIVIEDVNWLKYFLDGRISAGRAVITDPYIILGSSEKTRGLPENKGFSAAAVMLQEGKEGSSSVPEELNNIYIGELNINSGKAISYVEGRKDSIGEYYIIAEDMEIKEGAYPKTSSISFILRDVCKTFERGYKLTIGNAQFIGRKNLFTAENVNYNSDWSDEDYFASLSSRKDKFAFGVESLSAVTGEIIIGEKPRLVVENIKLQKPRAHITTPKYIPLPENAPKEVMPNEALLSLPFGIKIDNLYAEDGSIILHELYKQQGEYAKLVFGKIKLEARDITGRYFNSKAPARLQIKAHLQDKAEMDLDLTMPLQERDFSYTAKGSLKKMDLRELNGFLEDSEYIQITSGTAEKVDYQMSARNGYAEVITTPVYRDLKIKALDEDTGKESGLDEITASFIANKFILRKSNPDEKEGLITANVTKTFGPNETFFERLWLPLKRGLGQTVGFEE